MLETGWSEAVLATTSPVTVAKMRHALYARAHRPAVEVDIDDGLTNLHEAMITDAKVAEANRVRRIRRNRDALAAFRPIQAKIRALLYLDDEDPIPEDAA